MPSRASKKSAFVHSCCRCAYTSVIEPDSRSVRCITATRSHLRSDAQIVRDEQHGQVESFAYLVEQRQHLRLYRHVER